MGKITEYIEKDREYLKIRIIQDVELDFVGIDGLIAYFKTHYKGHRIVIYSKDKQAYLRIDMKDPNYKETIIVHSADTGKIMELTVLYDGELPKIDLDDLLE